MTYSDNAGTNQIKAIASTPCAVVNPRCHAFHNIRCCERPLTPSRSSLNGTPTILGIQGPESSRSSRHRALNGPIRLSQTESREHGNQATSDIAQIYSQHQSYDSDGACSLHLIQDLTQDLVDR